MTAAAAYFHEVDGKWGLLRLDGVEPLATFKKEKQRGAMRVEDFFSAWEQTAHAVDGKIIYLGKKKTRHIPIFFRAAEFDPLLNEMILMAKPTDKRKIPTKMDSVELIFYIDPEDRVFWDKWMGL